MIAKKRSHLQTQCQQTISNHLAKNADLNIIQSMSGSKIRDNSVFKREYLTVTLSQKSAMIVDVGIIKIDPLFFFFQRLGYALETTIFKYELCSYPSTLFDMHEWMLYVNSVSWWLIETWIFWRIGNHIGSSLYDSWWYLITTCTERIHSCFWWYTWYLHKVSGQKI